MYKKDVFGRNLEIWTYENMETSTFWNLYRIQEDFPTNDGYEALISCRNVMRGCLWS